MMAANFPHKRKFVAIVIYLFRVFIFLGMLTFARRLVRWSDGQLFFTHGEFVIIAVFMYHVFRSFR
jgi:hypothetical protein